MPRTVVLTNVFPETKPSLFLFENCFRLTATVIQSPGYQIWCLAWFLITVIQPYCPASDFVFDKAVMNGEAFSVIDAPMEWFWKSAIDHPEFTVQKSEYPLGYTATWSIESDCLYLSNIEGLWKGRKTSVRDFFESDAPILATWFTGTIQLVKGSVGSGRVGKRFPEVVVLCIENGLVKKTRTLNEHEIVWPGRIGVTLEKVDGRVIVKSVASGFPAERSNRIQVGDEIIAITSEDWGEKQLAGEELRTINGFIRGLSGTTIRIARRRTGIEDEYITLERSAFEKG